MLDVESDENFIVSEILGDTFLGNVDKDARKIKSAAYVFNVSSNYHEMMFERIVVGVVFVVTT